MFLVPQVITPLHHATTDISIHTTHNTTHAVALHSWWYSVCIRCAAIHHAIGRYVMRCVDILSHRYSTTHDGICVYTMVTAVCRYAWLLCVMPPLPLLMLVHILLSVSAGDNTIISGCICQHCHRWLWHAIHRRQMYLTALRACCAAHTAATDAARHRVAGVVP